MRVGWRGAAPPVSRLATIECTSVWGRLTKSTSSVHILDQRTRGNKHDARIFIDINRDSDADGTASGSDAAATGVTVTVELRDSVNALIGRYSGTTNSGGIFRSNWIRNLGADTYRAEVVDLAHATFNWNQLLTPNDDDEDGDGLPDDSFTIPA